MLDESSAMMQSTEADKSAILQAGLAKIRERFIGSLEGRIDQFCGLLERLENPETEESACQDIRAEAHKLHGICGSVGFPTCLRSKVKVLRIWLQEVCAFALIRGLSDTATSTARSGSLFLLLS